VTLCACKRLAWYLITHYAKKGYGEWRYSSTKAWPRHGTRWKNPCPLKQQVKEPSVPDIRSGRFGWLLPLPGMKLRFAGCLARSAVTVPTPECVLGVTCTVFLLGVYRFLATSQSCAIKLQSNICFRRSLWPRCLWRGSAAARLLGLRVRIPPGAWMSVCCEYYVLSGRGLCVELITRPEESYRVWCVWVWSWSLDNKVTLAH
jgi:hypothetical protein